jgi:hypothetical protein
MMSETLRENWGFDETKYTEIALRKALRRCPWEGKELIITDPKGQRHAFQRYGDYIVCDRIEYPGSKGWLPKRI